MEFTYDASEESLAPTDLNSYLASLFTLLLGYARAGAQQVEKMPAVPETRTMRSVN